MPKRASAPKKKPSAPNSPRSAPRPSTAPRFPAPIPGSIYIGEPEPGNRYRLFLTANGFAHPRQTRRFGATRTPDRPAGRLLPEPSPEPRSPNSTSTSSAPNAACSPRRPSAGPTRCKAPSRPGTRPSLPRPRPSTSRSKKARAAAPARPRRAPSAPPSQPGSAESTAGAHTPFSLELTRPDGDQDLSALNVTTPPGFSATLKGIPYCSDAALAAAAQPSYSGLQEESSPSCPAASQIGTAQAGAGAGDHPVYLPGKVYLAGPYKGAPLSLAVITPAVSGPYDLGNVVVRAALHVNPETAQITAVSDPLPQILEGIPLRLRSIRIDLNRPNFALNPTNCDPFSVDTEVFGEEGALAKPSAHFQVANCRVLPFAPKLTMGFSGSTKHAGNPALHAILTAKPGEANIAEVQVTLPHSEFLDNAHIQAPCTRVQYAAASSAHPAR